MHQTIQKDPSVYLCHTSKSYRGDTDFTGNATTMSLCFGFRKSGPLGKRSSRLTGFKLLTSHLPKEDGAEQEDGVQEQEAEAQPTIQSPVVQVHTQYLKAGESVFH